jgi:predicted unusual protein kinase regulating ubiquinone biosynthesis (AarF/ABC1/UbiB family)
MKMVYKERMPTNTSNRLKRIKSGVFSRGFALAQVAVGAGARAASHAVGNIFADESEKAERFKEMLISQMDVLAKEFGQLKGSIMKVGQMLSVYGEHFLPPEANAILKSLQNQSPPLEWKGIEKVLKKQLSKEILDTIEVERDPLASASLGQVHLAHRKSDGLKIALKIQYPGVDRAIEGDLKALKSIFSISRLIPKGQKYDALFEEVQEMLYQEVDYKRELVLTQEFQALLKNNARYVVPTPIPELSTKRVLATTLEEGVPVDSPEVLGLSQERRNELGNAALELYFRELFVLGAVQTDPHFGNYRIRLRKDENDIDRLILLDFGAVRKLPDKFRSSYLKVVRGAFERDPAQIVKGALEMDFLRPEDPEELRSIFVDLSFQITEPFYSPTTPGVSTEFFNSDGSYRWGESDLPKRVARKGSEFGFAFRLRPPPREFVFLDRKLAGIFIFLSVLKVQIRGSDVIDKVLVEAVKSGSIS